MKIKKAFMVVVLATAVGLTGLQLAKADEPRGDSSPRHFHKLDDATKAKIEKFQVDNKDLRKQIAMKQAEQTALTRSETPNIEAVRKTSGELFDLRTALMEKAKAAELFMFMKRDDKDKKLTEKHEKIEKFFADTKDLRKQIFVKRAEKQDLMHNRTPDIAAISKITGELFDLRTTIQEKAKEAGLPKHFHGMGWRKDHQGWKTNHHSWSVGN